MFREKLTIPHQMEGVMPDPDLVEEDPRFRCCCDLVHCKTGAYLIGDFSLIVAICGLIKTVSNYNQQVPHNCCGKEETYTDSSGIEVSGSWSNFSGVDGGNVYNWVALSCCILEILVTLLLFIGLIRNGSGWIIPYLVTMILKMIGIVGAVIVALLMTKSLRIFHEVRALMDEGTFRAMAVFFLLFCLHLTVWFHSIILRCYQYLEHLSRGCLRPPGHFEEELEINALTFCEPPEDLRGKSVRLIEESKIKA